MKNIFKRAMALLLVACMLLPVIPADIFRAEAVAVEGDVITYTVNDPLGRDNHSGNYIANLSGDYDLGDFRFVARGSNNNYTRLIKDSNTGVYRVNIQTFQLADGATNRWIALKFNVAEAGKYNLQIQKGTLRADVIVERYDATKTYDDAYVAALTAQGTTDAAITYTLEAADYVLFLKSNSTTSASHSQLYGMTLTVVPVVVEYDFNLLDTVLNIPSGNTASSHVSFLNHDTEINAAIEAGTINYAPYAYYSSALGGAAYIENGYRGQGILHQGGPGGLMAVRLVNPGAGTYEVNVSVNHASNGTNKAEVYFIPVSDIEDAYEVAFAADETVTKGAVINEMVNSGDYAYVGTAACYGGTYTAITPVRFNGNEDYVVVFYSRTSRYGTDFSTMDPATATANDKKGQMDILGVTLTKWTDSREAAAVVELIAAIDANITLASEPAILAARTAYDALTLEQKLLVTNYDVLTAAEEDLEEEKTADPVADQAAADAVIALIAAIDAEITLNSETAIVDARTAYDLLTERQKGLVTNYNVLTAAEAALQILLDEAAVNAVIGAIDAIGTVELSDEAAIGEARTMYNALRDELKTEVANYDALTAAEAALAQLKQQAAIDDTIAKIDAIGTVTLDSADAISAARTAYNALSDGQKALVTNYQTLLDAEFALKDLRNPNPDPDTFDGYVYDFTEAVDVLQLADGGFSSFNNADLNAAYPSVLNYAFYASNKAPYVSNGYRPGGHQTILVQGYAQDWFAVKIKSPGAGTYRFSFTYPAVYNANYSQKLDAYMLPISVITDAMTAAGEGATEASVINSLLADENIRKQYIAASKNVKNATRGGTADKDDFWGTVAVTSEEEYVVIFHAAENKAGSADATLQNSDNNVWICISGFNLVTPPTENDVAKATEVMEMISGIGTVIRGSKDKIEAARAAYDALTDKQKELVENLAVLEAAEQRLAVLLDPNNPIEYIYFDPGNAKTNNGYPGALGLIYGDFTDYARSGLHFKPYASYLQPQTSFVKGKWIGMKFTVDQAGDYAVSLKLTNSGSDKVTLDVYFVRAEELIQGSGNTKNQAFVDGLASNSNYKCYKVDVADTDTLSLTGVQLDADEYVIVMINTSGYTEQISETEKVIHDTKCNFSGFNIVRTGDYTGPEKVIEQPLPDPNTDKLVYDFYYAGTPGGTDILNSAILEVMSKEYALNKLNWKPVADKLNTVYGPNYNTTFQDSTDTKRYPWYGIVSSTTVGEWMAVQIKAPGTGTYDLILEHGKHVNGSASSATYVIPVSALADLSVASIDAAIADDTYKLIGAVSYKGSGSGHVTEIGQVNFEKGKDYIVVLHATTNKHGSKNLHEDNKGVKEMYESFLLPQKLTVTKFTPPAPLDQKEVVYNFHRPDMGETTSIFTEKNLGTMATEYVKGISPWKPFANNLGTALESFKGSVVYLNGNANSYKYEAIMANSLPGEWVGFQIKSPGKGLYTLSLTYGITTNCTNKAEIHVIPVDKLSGSDAVKAVEDAIATGDYKLQRDINMKKNYGTDPKYSGGNYGQIDCEIGQEFIVVFKAITNKHGGEAVIQKDGKTAYQGFMILKEMKLTYATKAEVFEEPEEVVPDITGQADPEAAAVVIALINAIGKDITLDSSAAIQDARTHYDLLTETQKALVTNYQTLVDAEAKLAELVSADDKVKADAVIEKIDAIGEVTLESESKIVAARIAYTLLTNQQRALVTNYSKLLAAEAKLAELKGESNVSPLDQASADAVEALISKIGTVTLESEVYISAARNAYNALTDTQKLLVENYADLVAAERTFAELKAEQDADAAQKEAAKRKAQQITIMIISALVAVGAAGTVAIFAVPGLKEKFMALIAGLKKKK